MIPSGIPGFLYSQFFVKPPYPQEDLTGKTLIVTGANTGLGLEASRHFARLGAEKVILACRNVEKGEKAWQSILESTKRSADDIEMWPLDLASYESVKKFAERCQGLKRLDAVCENAGVSTEIYSTAEDNETTITTNVISTFLLALLLLPKLRESAEKYNILPRLTIVGSEAHQWAPLNELQSDRIFETMNDKDTARMGQRYFVSKLLDVLATRELAERVSASKKPKVVVNVVNPGFCYSELVRDPSPNQADSLAFKIILKVMARTTEMGSRPLVHATLAGEESHGQYCGDGTIKTYVLK